MLDININLLKYKFYLFNRKKIFKILLKIKKIINEIIIKINQDLIYEALTINVI